MKQYLELINRVVKEGEWINNPRTKEPCLTVINADMKFDCSTGQVPLVTTRRAGIKLPIAELLGYLRGINSAADFRQLGTKSWDANANENEAWLANPNRKGLDDMGRVYGVQGRDWKKPGGGSVDQLEKIYSHLVQGIDDRGEILSFWNPGEFDQGCLRPCMYEHQFSILNGTLHLNSTQRSADLLLGTVANMVQCYVLLTLMAQITKLKPGFVNLRMVNCHIYERQHTVLFDEGQLKRVPRELPTLKINPKISTLEDVLSWVTVDDFTLEGYDPYPAIKYPFTV